MLKAFSEEHKPKPPGDLNSDLPAGFADLLMRLLRQQPEQRCPQSAKEVASALGKLEHAVPSAKPAPSRVGRGLVLAAIAMILGVLTLVVGLLAYVVAPLLYRSTPPTETHEPPPIIAESKPESKPEPNKQPLLAVKVSMVAGGPAESRRRVETGAVEGTIELVYDMYKQPDRLKIYYDGKLIHDTGMVSDKGKVQMAYGPGSSTVVEIVMNEGGSPQGQGTAWKLSGQIIPKGATRADADVIAKDSPQVQTVTLRNPAGSGGLYNLVFNGATTPALQFRAGAAQVQAALNALPTIGGAGGTVTVTLQSQTATTTVFAVRFSGVLAEGPLPLMTSITAGGLSANVARP